MAELPPSLRKAAVLIAALDAASADALLDQMSADDAAKVRRALMELDETDAGEQQRVLADFLRQQRPDARRFDEADVALELDPQVEAAAEHFTNRRVDATATPSSADFESLDFLEEVDPLAIARLLAQEHPQTAAVVVSHLSPERAAAVLQELPSTVATDALERIATIDAIAPEVLAELAKALRRQLAPHLRAASTSAAPLAHLNAVLEAMDFRQRQRLLLQLGQRNASLLKRLGVHSLALAAADARPAPASPRYRLDSDDDSREPSLNRPHDTRNEPRADDIWLTFDDLEHFSDSALKAVFAMADAELGLLALTGAAPRLVGRVLRKMPAHAAALLRQRLEHPAAVRLRDIEQARLAIAAVASRLAHEGTIELPANLAFAAAV